jgi:SAM-dependent methyltransferase
MPNSSPDGRSSYGSKPLSWVDRFGRLLSQFHLRSLKIPKSGLKVLDVGSGFSASNLEVFKGRSSKLVALDYNLDPSLLNDPRYSLVEGDVEADKSLILDVDFDLVLMINVVEHFRNPRDMLSWAHERLKAGGGGTLVVNVPTWRGKFFLEFSAFRLGLSPAAEMNDHKMYYSKRDLWPLVVAAGFKPSQISIKSTKFGLNLFCVAVRE